VASAVLYTVPWLVGAATAATAGLPPSPPPDALLAYVQANGAIVGGVTVAYVAARWLLQRNESTHWIAQGRALAAIAAITGVAGTALLALTNGTPWSGVLVTAVLGLLHLADATVTPAPVAKQSQAGFARIGLLVAIATVGWLTIGCGATQRTDTIKAAFVTVDGARDGFLAYDHAHEQQLVAQSVSPDDAHAKLSAYQAKRAVVDPLFGAAYRGIAAAQILDDDTSLTGMQAAIAQLFAALKPLLGGK
jgi:hypothetical protein